VQSAHCVGTLTEGQARQVLTIPPEVDVDRITAEIKMGVLTVHLPKIKAVKPRTIPVNAE